MIGRFTPDTRDSKTHGSFSPLNQPSRIRRQYLHNDVECPALIMVTDRHAKICMVSFGCTNVLAQTELFGFFLQKNHYTRSKMNRLNIYIHGNL